MALQDSITALQNADTTVQTELASLKNVQSTIASTITTLQGEVQALTTTGGFAATAAPVVAINSAITALQGV